MQLAFKGILAAAWRLFVKDPRNLFYPLRYWKYSLAGIYLFNGNRIIKHRSARIEQRDGRTLFGNIRHPFRASPGFIRMEANAKLIITGDVDLADGVMIELGPGATLEIGGDTRIYANAMIGVKESIRIGRSCGIADEVGIVDTDVHFILDHQGNKMSATAPIEIGDHVWIGERCTIMKGSRIESGAVIGATVTVQGRIPAKGVVEADRPKVLPLNVEWAL